MELSLQSKTNLRSVYNQREQMIEQERLHVSQKIDYEHFKVLYQKYGSGFSEKEFAKYFLDIDNMKHYYIQSGKTKETPALTKEYISDEEIDRTKESVIKYYELEPLDKIVYVDFVKMYERFSGKMSEKIFAEEVLNISYHTIECWKSDPTKSAVILKSTAVDRKKVKKIRQDIVEKANLHIGTRITNDEFQKLYSEFGQGLTPKEFGEKVLLMSSNSLRKLQNGDGQYASVFSTYIVNPYDIYNLREQVILKENLHIDDVISNERFKELYQKYGGILSEEMFAGEILDISAVSVKNMRVSGTNAVILQNIEVPEEYIDYVRKRILEEKGLEQNQLLNYEQIRELYEKYGYVLSEKMFAVDVLDSSIDSYRGMKCGQFERMSVMRNQQTTDFEALRKIVIEENHLHYDDKMNYHELEALHKKYAPNVRMHIFAERVLDIGNRNFHNIKFDKESNTHILSKEKLPTDEEFEKLKEKVLYENKLHIKDTINYRTFRKLHLKYGGIVPAYMFADRILDIEKNQLTEIENKPRKKVQILLKTKMEKSQVEKLKSRIILENSLYYGRNVTYEEFKKLYKKYDHILSEIAFAKEILGINRQNLKNLRQGINQTVRVLTSEESGQKRKKRKYFNDAQVAELKEYLIQNLSEEEIATRMGITLTELRKNTESLFRYDRLSHEEIDLERVSRLYQENKTVRQIIKLTGISEEFVKTTVDRFKEEEKENKKSKQKN